VSATLLVILREVHYEGYIKEKEKSEAIPVQSWIGTEVSRRLRLPDLKTITT